MHGRTPIAAGMALSIALASGGCAVRKAVLPDSARTVRPSDFAASDATVATGPATAAAPRVTPVEPPGPTMTASPMRTTAPVSIQARPGRPVASADARPVEAPVLLDAKVGDINGRPIYADEFLAPMAARLRAEATRLKREQWMVVAEREIGRQLDGLLTDELLRAEALATLNPEQKQGLRAFLENVRTNLVSENLGSEQAARQRLESEEGKSLEQYVRDEEELTLVRITLINEINRRVNVSWRDIQQRFERDAEIYNPPPTAVFRLIRVPKSDQNAVAEIQRRLDAGESFEAVASSGLNRFNAENGGIESQPFDGELAGTAFFGPSELNEAAWTLSPGRWAGPIEFGTRVGWLMLDRIERTSVPLYDAQLKIHNELTVERRQEQLDRYVSRLVGRAKVGNLDEMRARLVEIAAQRYGPSEG